MILIQSESGVLVRTRGLRVDPEIRFMGDRQEVDRSDRVDEKIKLAEREEDLFPIKELRWILLRN